MLNITYLKDSFFIIIVISEIKEKVLNIIYLKDSFFIIIIIHTDFFFKM